MRRTELIEVDNGRATHLKVELYYSKGGMNYFTSKNERRGLYLSVSPVSRTQHEGYGVSEEYSAFSGVKQLVLEMARLNQKTLRDFVIDETMRKQMIDYVCNENKLTLKSLETQK